MRCFLITRRHLPNPTTMAFVMLAAAIAFFLHTVIIFSSFSSSSIYFESAASSIPCYIPHLNPWDPTILPYITAMPPLVCPSQSKLLQLVQDSLSGSIALIAVYPNQTSCRYRTIERGADDFTLSYGDIFYDIKSFPLSWPQSAEIIEITCKVAEGPENDAVEEYLDIFTGISRPVENVKAEEGYNKDAWNIVIVGIDSISQLNFARSLPNTLKKLKEAGGVVLEGYNKVGENTFPNLVPLLTGKRVELFPDEDLQLPHLGINGEIFDDYPFIWNEFEHNNYAVMYSEDMPRIGTFTWQKNGFRKQPTRHYGRTVSLALESLHPYDSIVNPVLQLFEAKNIHLTGASSLCFQGRKKHNIFWDYAVKQFISNYKNKQPYFTFSWLGEPSHDHVNLISICDDDLAALIDWLRETIDNRTFVFLISDHGARFDDIRNTVIGRIEDRMPFFSVLPPKSLSRAYPKMEDNLRKNANRLTTVFDIHQTLRHILYLSTEGASCKGSSCLAYPRLYFLPINKSANVNQQWSASILAEVLPDTRTCWQASVPEHYCACYKETAVQNPNNNGKVVEAAHEIVLKINDDLTNLYRPPLANITRKGIECAQLALDSIESASAMGAGKSVVHDLKPSLMGWLEPGRQIRRAGASSLLQASSVTEYVIVARTKPSGGLFEAHVRSSDDDENNKNRPWTVVGQIERINAYANQSWCISGSSAAKKFCYCRSIQ